MPGRTAPASANRSSRAVGEEEVDRRTDDARKRIGVRARTTGKPVCGKKRLRLARLARLARLMAMARRWHRGEGAEGALGLVKG